MSSNKKIEVVIKISQELYDDLKKQLELLKQSDIAKFKGVHTVEDLVSEFLQSLTNSKEDFMSIQEKMFTVFKDLDKKQKIIKEIFNSFAKEWEGFKPDSDDIDDELFDDLDEEDENKKDKKKTKDTKGKKN
ncbi:hypothetical protein A6V39_05605 [Candidatus Mycoplasma haematobovis]|uniref:Uncharacterized protein n=1 Tax=Candidatus Mycoplasma haematobovis TaxID=432608 RepID=A0A1A9QFS0_9MOLU|nr:hypothetical protein [Candidatus Mycoplasma haematobovis]OAL10815.1 hypothetical protein A6V39_05605 [Candidatus Mycoplasma haematobovis]